MRKTRLVLLSALLVAFVVTNAVIAAPKPAAKPAKPAAKAEFDQDALLQKLWNGPDTAVVGKVNGVAITKRELMNKLWFWYGPETLQNLMQQRMIEQAAKKQGVALTAKEKQDAVAAQLKRAPAGTSLSEFLAMAKATKQRFFDVVFTSLLVDKAVRSGIKVSDIDLMQYARLRHILIRLDQSVTDEKERDKKAKDKADKIYQEVIKPGADFAAIANKETEDPQNVVGGKNQGGDRGWVTKGMMPDPYETKAFSMKKGEISEPIKTDYAYYIVKFEKSGRDATPAEKAQLKEMIIKREVPPMAQPWFAKVQAGAKMEDKLAPPTPKPRPDEAGEGPERPSPMRPRGVTRPDNGPPPPPPPVEKPGDQPPGPKPETPPPPPAEGPPPPPPPPPGG